MAKRGRIGAGDKWASELIDVLSEFVDEEAEIIGETFKETANETKEMVQGASPGTGEYASGWEVIEKNTADSVSYTVGNTKYYMLTHLLEKGHAVKNQYGEPSRAGAKARVRGKRHIKPAEIWGNETLLERLRNKL